MLMLVLTSCLEDINLDSIAQKHLVIEARVPLGEQASVLITETVSRTAPDNFPNIENAEVQISDESGNAEILSYEADGVYRSASLSGALNVGYFLEVKIGDIIITGTSLLPAVVVEVDSIWYEEKPDTVTGFNDAFINYTFTTPPGDISHGLAKVYINGNQQETVHFFKNANQFNQFRIPSNTILGAGQEIKVELQRMEPAVYTYLKTIYERRSSSSLTISPVAPPDNPVVNLDGEVLGFFSAMTIGQKIIITD